METLGVLQDGADRAETKSPEAAFTCLSQVQKHVDALNVEEVKLRPFVAEDGVRKAIDNRQKESAGISRLLNFRVSKIGLEDLNTALSSELFLVVSVVAAEVGDDVEGILAKIKMNVGTGLDDIQKNIDEPTVIEVDFEEIILGCLEDCLHASDSAFVVRVDLHHLDEVLVGV